MMRVLPWVGWLLAGVLAFYVASQSYDVTDLRERLEAQRHRDAAQAVAYTRDSLAGVQDSIARARERAAIEAALAEARQASHCSRTALERVAADTSLPDHVRAVADTAARTSATAEAACDALVAAADAETSTCEQRRTVDLGRIAQLEVTRDSLIQIGQDALKRASSGWKLGLTLGPGAILTPPDSSGGFQRWRVISGWCGIAGVGRRIRLAGPISVGGTVGLGGCLAEGQAGRPQFRPGAGAAVGFAFTF